ncbi:hypothetical protein [Streptomyces yangpuensis]|uniref:hypothetical protein n=1 Tax=Streptomyces yangpuensis TaxID=1648182 RepID=UPI003805F72A
MRRKILAAAAALLCTVGSGLLATPANATPSSYCTYGITSTGGIGACQGNPQGGSWYQIHATCRGGHGPNRPMVSTVSSPVTYAPPNQPGIYVQTRPCSAGVPTNAWATTW